MSSFSRFIATRIARTRHAGFTRTIIRIAVGAIAASLMVMILTVAMITGFKKEISQKVFGFWGHISISDIRADESYESIPIRYDEALMDTLRQIAQVSLDYGTGGRQSMAVSRGGIRHVQAVAHIPAIIVTTDQMEGIVLKGVGPDYDWSMVESFLRQGTVFDPADTTVAAPIMISEITANRLLVGPGDRFILHFLKEDRQIRRRYTVTGIYRTGLEDYDKKYAFAPLHEVQALLGWDTDQIAAIEVFVDHLDDAALISRYLYLEELSTDLFAQTIRQRFPNIFEWLDLQDINEKVILGLTLIVAIINMISALLILILERTPMIGILKALGSSNWGVQKIFLYHAAWIIGQGLLIGNILGISLSLIQKHYKIIRLNEADYYLSYAPIELQALPIVMLNAGTILLTLIFLIIPTLLVLRIRPVSAIQFR